MSDTVNVHTAESNKAKTIEAYRVVREEGDWEAFFKDFDPSVKVVEADSLPYGGVYHGIEGAKYLVQTAMGTWDNFGFEVEEIAAAGDLVFIYIYMRGTGKKTGKTFSYPLVEVWRFREGKVVEFRPFYWDTHRIRECYGD